MLKRTVLWASHFVGTLTAALISNTTPQTVIGPDGDASLVPPNPSMIWPPHRPHPTPEKHKRGYRKREHSIRQAMRLGGQYVGVSHPEKYLHASRTAR